MGELLQLVEQLPRRLTSYIAPLTFGDAHEEGHIVFSDVNSDSCLCRYTRVNDVTQKQFQRLISTLEVHDLYKEIK